jgi:hypothetical protein
VRELCSFLRVSRPDIFTRFPEFQFSFKFEAEFSATNSWKLRTPKIVKMDPEDIVAIQAVYTAAHCDEFDVASASVGSSCRAASMKYSMDWLFALVANGPRNRIIKSKSSIEGGDRVVQYCINGMHSYGVVVSIHQHVIFPHPIAKSMVLFKVQPWTVEPGAKFGDTFPRARLDHHPLILVPAAKVTNMTVFLWPATEPDASLGFTHNVIFMQ